MGADDARIEANSIGVVQHFVIAPAIAHAHEDGITDGLPGQGGTGCAEGDRNLVVIDDFEQTNDFLFALGVNDDLRNQPVETGVRAVGHGAQRVGMHALFGNEGQKILKNFVVWCR